MPRPTERWVFPVPGGPRKITFSRALKRSSVPLVRDELAH
jgi:hypothetical protein